MGRLGSLTGQRLLDVGCATGEYTKRLAFGFDRVEAIDIELDRLSAFVESNPGDNIRVHAMSVNELRFADESFDTVTMIEVLEHLTDPVAAVAEVGRVLRPGGQLLLTSPSRYWPLEQHGVLVGERRVKSTLFPGLVWVKPLHRRMSDADAFTRSDIDRLATEAGLRLDKVTYMMPPLDSLAGRGEVGRRVHDLLDRAEAGRLARLGQTIVARLVR